MSGGGSGRFALLEALPAKHRTTLRGFEWDRSLLLAPGADGLGFYSLIIAPTLGKAERLRAFGLAVLTTFGFVLELFVVEEKLLAGSENEIGAAIHALEDLVLELHLRVPPFLSPRDQAKCATPSVRIPE